MAQSQPQSAPGHMPSVEDQLLDGLPLSQQPVLQMPDGDGAPARLPEGHPLRLDPS